MGNDILYTTLQNLQTGQLQTGQVKEFTAHLFSYGYKLGNGSLFPRSAAERFAEKARGKTLTGTRYKVIDAWLEGDNEKGVVVGQCVFQEDISDAQPTH